MKGRVTAPLHLASLFGATDAGFAICLSGSSAPPPSTGLWRASWWIQQGRRHAPQGALAGALTKSNLAGEWSSTDL